jgi:hypothetical protein
MIDALIKRVSVTYKCYEMYAHRGKRCNCSCFEQYFSYIVAVNFIGGGNRNTRRKPPNLNPTTTHAREVFKLHY